VEGLSVPAVTYPVVGLVGYAAKGLEAAGLHLDTAVATAVAGPSLDEPLQLGPRYRELLADIFQRKILARDFSLSLHRPTATDPTLAPPGCGAFYVLSPVPNLTGATDRCEAAEP